jgi:hypothetical protein
MADAHHNTAEGDEGAVENPNSSAPSRAAMAMSRPVLSCPGFNYNPAAEVDRSVKMFLSCQLIGSTNEHE